MSSGYGSSRIKVIGLRDALGLGHNMHFPFFLTPSSIWLQIVSTMMRNVRYSVDLQRRIYHDPTFRHVDQPHWDVDMCLKQLVVDGRMNSKDDGFLSWLQFPFDMHECGDDQFVEYPRKVTPDVTIALFHWMGCDGDGEVFDDMVNRIRIHEDVESCGRMLVSPRSLCAWTAIADRLMRKHRVWTMFEDYYEVDRIRRACLRIVHEVMHRFNERGVLEIGPKFLLDQFVNLRMEDAVKLHLRTRGGRWIKVMFGNVEYDEYLPVLRLVQGHRIVNK